MRCEIVPRRGRWVCLTHDCEAVQWLPDAYIHHPTAVDYACPIGIETQEVPC